MLGRGSSHMVILALGVVKEIDKQDRGLCGSAPNVLVSVGTSIFACIILAIALEGYLYFFGGSIRRAHFSRALIFAGAIFLLYPGLDTNLIGIGFLLIFLLWEDF
jgi:TRAP-type uncharacterized transport system fused permease subunit